MPRKHSSADRPEISPFCMMPIDLVADPDLTRADLVVAGYILYRCIGRPHFWDSQEFIADVLGMSRLTVLRAIEKLDRGGYIGIDESKKRDGCHAYWVTARGLPHPVAESHPWNRRSNRRDTDQVTPVILPSNLTKESPEDSPVDDAFASTAPSGKTVSDTFRDRMLTKYGEQLGGELAVLTAIDDALNHKASLRWLNVERGIDGWLRRDVERRSSFKNGTIGTRRPQAPRTSEEIRAQDWSVEEAYSARLDDGQEVAG